MTPNDPNDDHVGHRAVLERLVDQTDLAHELSDDALVHSFSDTPDRFRVFLTLYARGEAALPAIRRGFEHPDWQVRKWCAICADNFADRRTLEALLPLVHDRKADVRRWAVHSLSCQDCKDGPNPIDYIPLLVERIETDPNLRVRRQAVAMLAHHLPPDPRVLPVFRALDGNETDPKLLRHVGEGLNRYAAAGLA